MKRADDPRPPSSTVAKWVIIAMILIWIVILVVVLAIWKSGMDHPPGGHSRYRISPERMTKAHG